MAIFQGRQAPAQPYGLRKGPLLIIGLVAGTLVVGWLQFGWWDSSPPKVTQATPAAKPQPAAGKIAQEFETTYTARLPAVPAVAQAQPNGHVSTPPPVDDSWRVSYQAKTDALMDAMAELKRQIHERPTKDETQRTRVNTDALKASREAAKAAADAAKAKMEARKQPHIHVAPVSKTPPVGVQPQAHPFSLSSGWLLPAIFEDRISNQTPGIAKFVVREDVMDSATGQYVMIPQGSHGLVRVTTGQLFGTKRQSVQVLSLTWRNGDRILLPNAHAGDQTGQSGLKDQVDARWGQLFASVILTGVLRGGTSMLISSTTGGANYVLDAVASESARAGQKQVQQFIDTTPILTIRQGYLGSIRLEEPLVIGKAYGQ